MSGEAAQADAEGGVVGEGEVGQLLPLSFSQQRIWFIEQLEGPSTQYNEAQAFVLKGPLDKDALQRALDELTLRHETLRTCFRSWDGQGCRRVLPRHRIPLCCTDLRGLAVSDRQAAVAAAIAEDDRRPFDLAAGPPVRAQLLQLDEATHYLLWNCHHLLTDGWSRAVFNRELGALYAACRGLPAEPLPPLVTSYSAQVERQLAFKDSRQAARELAYWEGKLAAAPAPAELPLDTPAGAKPGRRAGTVVRELPGETAAAVAALGRRFSASPFMVLLAAFKVLLARLSGQDDLLVGTPVAGRLEADLERLIGVFIETLPLRTDLAGNPAFIEVLQRVRTTVLDAFDHQRVPFEMLIQRLQPDRDLSRPPLFNVLFNMHSMLDQHPLTLAGLEVEELERAAYEAKFDLTLYITQPRERYRIAAVYRDGLFTRAGMERLLDQFHCLIEQIAREPERRIGSYTLVTPRTRALLPDPAEVLGSAPAPTVIAQFLRIAGQAPDSVAIRQRARGWTYRQLADSSAAVARALVRHGGVKGRTVAVAGGKSFGLYATVLGILRAGGVILLLDPLLPEARRRLLLQEGRATLVLAVGEDAPVGSGAPAALPVITVSSSGEPADGFPGDDGALPAEPGPGDPAYVFFTSGTTGVPKAILGWHKGLSHFIDWERGYLAAGPGDRVAQLTGLSFDVILRDIFLPLTSGAALALPDDGDPVDPASVLEWLARAEVTLLHTVPSLAQAWLAAAPGAAALPGLRAVLFAGEPLHAGLCQAWREATGDQARIINLYGPTETTMAKAFHEVAREPPPGVQPVGRPQPATQLLVLNPDNQLCGIREPGEIVIRTPYRTLGYLNARPGDQSRFFPNPFTGDPGDLLYRTGDLGAYAADGSLLIFGRTDDQVKIRGVRIEPGEIAARLEEQPGVRQCVVVAVAQQDGPKRLVAYYTAADAARIPGPGELRSRLRGMLPEHMVPEAFVPLERLPLTPNGKVDRRSLPPPDFTHGAEQRVASPPSGPMETLLAGIWSEVLGVSGCGATDNFFDLGGHSLLAARVVARFSKATGRKVPLRLMFEAPTIRKFVAGINDASTTKEAPGIPVAPASPQGRSAHLSPTQEGLWFIDRLGGGSREYNMSQGFRIKGPLDVDSLQRAIDAVVLRHQTLRTTFADMADRPVQLVHEFLKVPLEQVDAGAGLDAALRRFLEHTFDLGRGPLLRIALFRIGPDDHVLAWMCHHIISDGWSTGVLHRELAAHYAAFQAGSSPSLDPLAVQFADFCAWQETRLLDAALREGLDFWTNRLRDAPVLELPADGTGTAFPLNAGGRLYFSLPLQLSERLRHFNRNERATPFMSFMAAFQSLLFRYTGQVDIVTGTAVANRQLAEFEPLIGCFVNTVAQRTDFSADPDFRTLVGQVRAASLDAMPYQEIPFHKVVEALNPRRLPGRHPVFQVTLALNNGPAGLPALAGTGVRPHELPALTTHFDLELHLEPQGETWSACFVYRRSLFSENAMARMAGHFSTLLENLLAEPGLPVSRVPMTRPEEWRQLVHGWNATTVPYPRDATIHTLFKEQAAASPGAVAVVDGGTQLSYAELDAWADQVAALLGAAGVRAGDRVGLFMDRSAQLIAGALGILKAGAAYVPLARDYPSRRLHYMISDAGLRVILSSGGLPDDLDATGVRIIDPDDESTPTAAPAAGAASKPVSAADPAYVIYTSGSTGQPKGVVVPHRGVVRLVRGQGYAEFGPGERFLLLASPSFDASTFEIWGPLLNGATCVVFRPRYPDISILKEVIERNGITCLWLTAGLFNLVIDTDTGVLATVRHVLTGGEALSPMHVRKALEALPDLRLTNGYGPTECTTFACTHAIQREEPVKGSVSIGRPIANTTAYILDRFMQPVPVGLPGELWLGGDGLALGYLNAPGLTAEWFVPDPFSTVPGARLYRTGDRCRYLPDGRLDFIGRFDHQVKIRGFRVELGEIESALAGHGDITRVLAVAHRPEGGTAAVAAYFIPRDRERVPSTESLRAFMAERVPDHAVPAWFVPLDSVPLTPNGKVDTRALPEPAQAALPDNRSRAPSTPLERRIASIWSRLFGVEGIGCDDNFFDLGGHSLMATRLAVEIERATGRPLPIAALFEAPTVAQLARRIEADAPIRISGSLVPLQPEGHLQPLYCLHGWGGDVYGFIDLAKALAPERPVYGLQAVGLDGAAPRHTSVEQMADHYADGITAFQRHGPYNLIGYSAGGWIAYAVAQALNRDGHEVHLYMLDTGMSCRIPYILYSLTKTMHTIQRLPHHIRHWWRLARAEKFAYLKSRLGWFLVNVRRSGMPAGPGQGDGEPDPMEEKIDYFAEVASRYRPPRYKGDIVLFAAKETPGYQRWFWRYLIRGRIEVHFVDGGHFGMINRHHIGNFTRLFRQIMARRA